MVMVEDPDIRENRIRLLRSLAGLFLLVADISSLQE
jgi:glycyl-tRNA synthetase beta chain